MEKPSISILELESGDTVAAYNWMSQMIDSCCDACVKAEGIGLGAPGRGQTVEDVIAAFRQQCDLVNHHAQLVTRVAKKYGHDHAPIWPELQKRLINYQRRCTEVGDLIIPSKE